MKARSDAKHGVTPQYLRPGLASSTLSVSSPFCRFAAPLDLETFSRPFAIESGERFACVIERWQEESRGRQQGCGV